MQGKSKHTQSAAHIPKVVVYGGNGFVGTRVAEKLAAETVSTVCLSRTGHKPIHLKDDSWSESVRWCKGDARDPDRELLSSCDVLITLVGSAPVPTFSAQAYQQQVFNNGIANANAINAAAETGVKRVVLLGAKIPFLLNSDRFGYTKGKRLALEAAKEFSSLSDTHAAVVLQPGTIFGTRHLTSGKAIALGTVMKPMSYVLPSQFISVEKVAERIVDAALSEEPYAGRFTMLPHKDI